MSKATPEQVNELVEAMWQLLDDMGGFAKAQARVAYEPFLEVEPEDEALYAETWMSLEEAQKLIRDTEARV